MTQAHGWLLAFSTLVAGAATAGGQSASSATPSSGPVIHSAGAALTVEAPTFQVPAGHQFKTVFIIDVGGNDTTRSNTKLSTMARFYNLHALNGYPASRLQLAAVVFGNGWQSLLTDTAFSARFGTARNPSRSLVLELLQQGVQLVLCGQTAGAAHIRRDELLPGVTVAISAMTALNVLQTQGYSLNPW
jgi:intracellular sulfur oxidation DsrE/DsrF family protein